MTTPQVNIHDCVTGETIIRDMNESELAQWEADQTAAKKEATAKAKADKAKADTRQAVLDRLGITNDELLAILS